MNELATLDLTQLPSTQLGSDEAYAELAKGGDFLKYIKLYSKGKDIDKGKIRPGRWGIPESEDEIIDLGDSIDVLPLARRPKALDMSDKTAIVMSYDGAVSRVQGDCRQVDGTGLQVPARHQSPRRGAFHRAVPGDLLWQQVGPTRGQEDFLLSGRSARRTSTGGGQ